MTASDPGSRKGPVHPAVKICGLTRRVDARVAVEAGATYLGVVLVPESPRAVGAEQAAEIAGGMGARLALVTADMDPDALEAAARASGASVLQLHGDESPETAGALREAAGWEVWKAVRVREPEDVERAVERFRGAVDGIHLDGWHPRRRGGTGVRFPWEEVSRIRDRIPDDVRFVASGGLTPENVAEAVERLRPDVVDVSSGVEAEPGVKDAQRIRGFVREAGAPAARRPSPESSADPGGENHASDRLEEPSDP